MKRIDPHPYHSELQNWAANPQGIRWIVILLSVLICIIISWLHIQQEQILARTTLVLATMQRTHVDFAQVFLQFTLATDTSTPFERAQDLALLDQALLTFEQTASHLEPEAQLRKPVQRAVQTFRTAIAPLRAAPAASSSQRAFLLLAYNELMTQSDAIEEALRVQLRQLNNRVYVIYLWTLSIAALLLSIICVVHYYSGKAKAGIERSLREREGRYRTLFDNMAQGVFYQNSDGTISEINDAALTMLGLTRAEVLQRTSANPAWRVIREDGSPVTMEHHPSWLALQTGQAITNQLIGIFNPQKQDFTWVIINAIPQFEAGATKPYQAFVTFHDITERKAAESALRQERDRFQKIVDTAPGVVHAYRQRKDGTINFPYASPRITDIYGLAPEQLVEDASAVTALWHPDDITLLTTTITASLQAMKPWHAEFRVRHPTKGEIWVEGRSIPQTEADGSVLWYGVLTEITERKVAEALIQQSNEALEARVIERTNQLQVANQELEAFAYSVSHDLRAPLRALDGYTRILLEDYAPKLDAEALRITGIICAEAQRMGQLIDDLLNFSRLSRAQVQLGTLEMTQLVQETFAQLQTDPSLDFQLGPLPNSVGDRAMIRQVWQNLLANALKFSAKRAHAVVEVGSTQHADGQIYWVRDNGAGFDMRYVDKLFGVFQRLHSERDFPGTGVGLAIVQRIIQRHGGQVWAQGEVEQGATFYFMLPNH